MPHFPQVAAGLNYATYPAGPTPAGVTVSAPAAPSINTKGSYTEIASSTAFLCNRARIMAQQTQPTPGRQYLMDIATGSAGNEAVVIGNMPFEGVANTATMGAAVFDLPLSIASGTRIAARFQASTSDATVTVVMIVSIVAAGDTPGYAFAAAYGADTSDSSGASIDPGAAANTKGAYTQLSASTTEIIQHMTLATTFGSNSLPRGMQVYLDIATGAAASEVILINDSPMIIGGALDIYSREPKSVGYLTYIPQGTRLAVRASSNITDASDRILDAFIIAAQAPIEAVTTARTFAG